jgi:hypothetical protein
VALHIRDFVLEVKSFRPTKTKALQIEASLHIPLTVDGYSDNVLCRQIPTPRRWPCWLTTFTSRALAGRRRRGRFRSLGAARPDCSGPRANDTPAIPTPAKILACLLPRYHLLVHRRRTDRFLYLFPIMASINRTRSRRH